jgi:hypothetical protein
MTGELKRHAHIYVFCLHDHEDRDTLDLMKLEQWTFYVLPTARFDDQKQYENAKTIGLSSLLRLNPHCARYPELAECFTEVASTLVR